MEWRLFHLKTCHFQSALARLSTDQTSFWNIYGLSDSHAELHGNELAGSLAKTGATLPFIHVLPPARWPWSLLRLGGC